MPKGKAIKWKGVFVAIVCLALFACASVVIEFFTVPVVPIAYVAAPDFLQETVPSTPSIAVATDERAPAPATPAAPTLGSPADDLVERLAKDVLFEGQPPELFLELFGYPDQDVRVSAAGALARCYAANLGRIAPHAEGAEEYTRRFELMEKFWAKADKNTIFNALSELLSISVETGGPELHVDEHLVLDLLAEFPGLRTQRAEVLTWVAGHHPKETMRANATVFLLNDDFPREIGDEVLDSRTHDPSYMVRFIAWKERFSRIPSGFLRG